jgi:chromosome partitioning protein
LILSCHNQKGGSGKSTLCRVLFVEASRAGLSVYLIDFDRDGHTLTNWHQTCEAEEPRRVELSIAGLGEGLRLLEQQGAELVLIDTPPNFIQDMAEIFPLAD